METNTLVEQRLGQLQHAIEAVQETAAEQKDWLIDLMKQGERSITKTMNQQFSLMATQVALERLEFTAQDGLEKLQGLLEREYYQSEIIEAKLSKL